MNPGEQAEAQGSSLVIKRMHKTPSFRKLVVTGAKLEDQVHRLEAEVQECRFKLEAQAAETERLTFENGALTQAIMRSFDCTPNHTRLHLTKNLF